MDPRLLHYYNLELQHLREMGGEFAQQFPKIAARLGMSGLEVADPYVERLLEGAGFMAARVQLKMDAEFPRFTQSLLEIIYPHYLAPTPSMLVAQIQPDRDDPCLAAQPDGPRARHSGAVADRHVPVRVPDRPRRHAAALEIAVAAFLVAPDLHLNSLPFAQPSRVACHQLRRPRA